MVALLGVAAMDGVVCGAAVALLAFGCTTTPLPSSDTDAGAGAGAGADARNTHDCSTTPDTTVVAEAILAVRLKLGRNKPFTSRETPTGKTCAAADSPGVLVTSIIAAKFKPISLSETAEDNFRLAKTEFLVSER